MDEELLQVIKPDIIFTQDVCEVCQIDTACTAAAVAKLDKQPTLIPITPASLTDVFRTAITIATALGHEEEDIHILPRYINESILLLMNYEGHAQFQRGLCSWNGSNRFIIAAMDSTSDRICRRHRHAFESKWR